MKTPTTYHHHLLTAVYNHPEEHLKCTKCSSYGNNNCSYYTYLVLLLQSIRSEMTWAFLSINYKLWQNNVIETALYRRMNMMQSKPLMVEHELHGWYKVSVCTHSSSSLAEDAKTSLWFWRVNKHTCLWASARLEAWDVQGSFLYSRPT